MCHMSDAKWMIINSVNNMWEVFSQTAKTRHFIKWFSQKYIILIIGLLREATIFFW